jgi:hypothetical protein
MLANQQEGNENLDSTAPVVEPGAKVKYLTNKEFLAEIHKSKLTFCSYENAAHGSYDVILSSIKDITPKLIEETKARKAQLATQAGKKQMRETGRSQADIRAYEVTPESFSTSDLIFRVMTSQHIPLDPTRKRKGKGENGNHTRTPFLPFKHYYLNANDEPVECLRSHWIGTFADGEFSMTHGRMTPRLASMYILLVDRYSRLSNWRGYTYLDEMKNNALLQLSQIGLQFDEYKSDNPFAFYTTTIKNCFTHVLNREKRGQNLRDDILIMNGASPSYTRQNDLEYERGLRRHMTGGHGEVVHTVMPGYENTVESAIRAKAKQEEEDLIKALAEEPVVNETEEVEATDFEEFDNGITFPDELDDEAE